MDICQSLKIRSKLQASLKNFFEKRRKKEKSFSLYICDCYDEVDSCIDITKSHKEVIERYKAEGVLKNYKEEYDFIGDF